MTQVQLESFVEYLQKDGWLVFGPTETGAPPPTEEASPYLTAHQSELAKPKKGEVFINQIFRADELVLDERLPFYSFKCFFVPESETLFEYQETKLKFPLYGFPLLQKGGEVEGFKRAALLGVNILDLKAINLYDQVFEKDPYYQARRRNILIVGYSLVPEIEDNIFEQKYEEDILEHLPFDIFLAATNKPQTTGYKLFTGSLKGQRILEHFGYNDYQHIQFSGPVKEGKLDARMSIWREKLKNHHNQKIWEELGERCLECGKCTIVCPTCFCFRLDDLPSLKQNSGTRTRCWDSCFYQEFSEVAGPETSGRGKPKFLKNTAERIHFWYFHKFVRIPDEFDFMGCVGCRRCTKVCPVGIDIAEILKNIESS